METAEAAARTVEAAVAADVTRMPVIKTTTTKATHKGVNITVLSEQKGRAKIFSCLNDTGRSKLSVQWFSTQGEAIANERREIDAVLATR